MDFNNTRRNNFLGHDQFIWWIGVVENRNDPINCGRLQVRIKGLHTDDKTELPTKDLPWTQPLFPINSALTTPTNLKEGDMVVGFFLDGDAAQFPIVFGCFHGIPTEKAKPSKGFFDPRDDELSKLSDAPRVPKELIYHEDGSGIEIVDNNEDCSNPQLLNEPTVHRVARNEKVHEKVISDSYSEIGMVHSKENSLVKDVETAKGEKWDEPKLPYDPKFPYNLVTHTESGHYLEFDDTPKKERIHWFHRSGSFTEYHPEGTRVEKVAFDNYTIIMKDDHVYIMGKCDITVQKDATLYVKGNLDIKCDKDINVNAKQNINITAKQNVNIKGSKINLN